MTRKKFNESLILKIIREKENGIPIHNLTKKYGISQATIYNWRAKYGNSDMLEQGRIHELLEENDKLKRMYADLSLENLSLRKQLDRKKELSKYY
ncbi:MAG: transposase [Mariniphaga sp.]|nr:transposase [Mariniphaga sp.]